MKTIFDEVKINKLKVKNRIIRSATWEGMAPEDGSFPEELFNVYHELAKGGVGTIITGFTSVADEDQYFNGITRLSNDKQIPSNRKVIEMVHGEDVRIISQLALGGYYKIFYDGSIDLVEPDRMSTDDIKLVINQFKDAAIRAMQAGFDGVQIHGAHHFFLSRFISPVYNHRADEYGKDVFGRMKILKDIYLAISEVAPSLHISMKINCSDFILGGLTEDESMMICEEMAKLGIDSIEVSGNGTSRGGIRVGVNEAYFGEFAASLAERVDTPIILVGGHRSIENMEKVLNSTKIEMLSISRPLIREPGLINRWKSGDSRPATCVSCNACYNTPNHKCIFVLRGME
ncbi:NADH:flavin oxidoreductase [Clostridium estertheticum]|nr:NADH:flavin oxidoreductase [Clostridium estertheticum]MBU3199228.1 NADH:flavin oxidoreductase [Clostridium estertheticum]WAG67521.1 NADH:flavin oxidoreductase [Clostridium estertheticum]